MKFKFLIVVFCVSIWSCTVDNNNGSQTNYKVEWHLTAVSGGLSGVNETFNMGSVIWTFNEFTGVLTVVNNNEDTTKEDSYDSGSYPYSIENLNSKLFLSVDDIEIGEVTFPSQTQFIIDQNSTSQGSGADGYVYKFTKKLVEL